MIPVVRHFGTPPPLWLNLQKERLKTMDERNLPGDVNEQIRDEAMAGNPNRAGLAVIRLLAALFLAMGAAVPAMAELQFPLFDYERDRFRLWNNCQPIDLVVEGLPESLLGIGLTEARIETAVRARLRGARVYDEDASAYLYVRVNGISRAFSIDVAFNKRLTDPASGFTGLAETWDSGSVGTHGGGESYVLSGLHEHVDVFIDAYLRVNDDACR